MVKVYRIRKKKRKNKRTTRLLRPGERAVRRFAIAGEAAMSRYLREHRRSRRKKGDGYLRDLPDNVFKAVRRGNKKLKLRRIFRI